MSVLQNKIDFAVLVSVDRANCNGDPLNGNRPRTGRADRNDRQFVSNELKNIEIRPFRRS